MAFVLNHDWLIDYCLTTSKQSVILRVISSTIFEKLYRNEEEMGHPGNDWWLPPDKYVDLDNYKGWAQESVTKHDQMSTIIISSIIFKQHKVEQNKIYNVRIFW